MDARGRMTDGALLAAAFVLAGMVLVQAGGRGGDPGVDLSVLDPARHAQAGLVSEVGGFTIMTAAAGNEEVLVVLDNRREELFVYKSDSTGALELFQREGLARLFNDAKARTRGRD